MITLMVAALAASDIAQSVALQPMIAYIDPVSGSLLLQAILAVIVGAVAFFRRSIATVFKRVLGKKDAGH